MPPATVHPPEAAPLDRQVLEEAARWYVRLQGGDAEAPSHDRRSWQSWLDEAPAHRRAWERVRSLEARMGRVPADLAVPALKASAVRPGRRVALKALGLAIGVGAIGWTVAERAPWQGWRADCRTGTGERRSYRLADGSMLELNTGSAVDVAYTGHERLLELYEGEILVNTHPDGADRARPFIVHTRQGRLTALGTRFIVRQLEGATRLTVLEHAVRVEPADASGQSVRVAAGQQLLLRANGADAPQAAPAYEDAWSRGMLVALDWRLDEFLHELQRYRPGVLSCDAHVAGLKVSGVFRLDQPEAVLHNLSGLLPVRVQRLGRWWTRVSPA
ncbi:MAG TPA: FecR domain-containing protein [Candidatus Aquabacterium excrementipullorum]|nr:FecR domain-containing protein [Candidatus Aquabacterium excrementipullorum]